MIGHLLTYLFVLSFWTFMVGYFLVPITLAYWRHSERLRAEQTEKTLESLGLRHDPRA